METARAPDLSAVLEATGDAVVVVGAGGLVDAWSPSAERLFGWSAGAMLGTPFLRLAPAEAEERVQQLLKRARAGGRMTGQELLLARRDGSRVSVSLTIVPTDADGATGAVIAMRDLTRERALEDSLRQAQKMESVGQLASGIAHDFNNLITIIRGFTSFLGRVVPENSPGYGDLLGIEQASERAARLTEQLLAFGRRHDARVETLDLSEVTRETAAMLGRLLGSGIRLEVRPAERRAPVRADRGHLSQVIMNLALNGRDAMPQGGTLLISTFVDEAARWVTLTVRDTGQGMDLPTQRRAFEPFFTTKPHGTGLGLATVAGIVREARGQIEVDSEPGRGTVFRIMLPLAGEDAAEAGSAAVPDPHGRETVLVVDDEPMLVELAVRTLTDFGYQALSATGPGAAMLRFAERVGRIDLLLTDVMMPGMNGQTLAGRLRLQDPQLPVVYMSGLPDAPGGTAADAPLLPKPFTPLQLATAVRGALDARRPG